MSQKFKASGNRGFFDNDLQLKRLSMIGNPLEVISKVIDFEEFRTLLENDLLNTKKKNRADDHPYDYVMMFKIIILQRYYGLGDQQVEYQIIDRISFKKFLGLSSGDKIPDEKTVWAFREELTQSGLIEKLFEHFTSFLEKKGLIFEEGKIIDASFTLAPRQRNTKEENEIIKEGKGDTLWNDNLHKKSHKDIDARWTKKHGETFLAIRTMPK
ncbi:MAG: transposase [Phycisphaerales bacterium]|nr:transposase [Phycisphaerales bacterium]